MEHANAALSFCIVGMPAREQLVFKSLMRLLATRLHNPWVYQPEAQLLVVGELPLSQDDLLICSAPGTIAKLHVGTNLHERAHSLSLPIKANILEERINALGNKIVSTQKIALSVSMQTTPSLVAPDLQNTVKASPIEQDALDLSSNFKLKRWPPSKLLHLQGRIRMATVLLRRPVSLQELSTLANQEERICKEFLEELWQIELLSTQATELPVLADAQPATETPKLPQAPTHKAGLLSRIRSRLGL